MSEEIVRKLTAQVEGLQAHVTLLTQQLADLRSEQAAMDLEHQRLISLVENSKDIISFTSVDGEILYLNPAGIALLGLESLEAARAKLATEFYPQEDLPKFDAILTNLRADESCQAEIRLKNFKTGELFLMALNAFVIRHPVTGEVLGLGSFNRDIRERRRSEEQLKSTLGEKELLLKEIHHRVKNNLQIVSSLLRLQVNTVRDKQAKAALNESRNRIRAMAVIHEILYGSSNLAKVDFAAYTDRLTQEIANSYGTSIREIQIHINAHETYLGTDTIIPCGLIVTELVSNAIKYAFPDGKRGEIQIYLRVVEPHRYELVVMDDGVGLPPGLNIHNNSRTLGLQLVCTLVRQLQGTIEVESGSGTRFKIYFTDCEEQSATENALPCHSAQ